ncbi:uncharacterized protein PV07_11853 [Cladophialophora immunda]|uniref:Protein kinase domain-containing protein n=1 Tax=Cladophialophora immunda TaxID=569365 RepID=A0A0D2BX29_9EURO|nr:uncharacterized protein PV07_11853 [Cladophialophora immunda]KIW23673.1 hypothetical protein PV07_11853 [Cladophialophora immunda]
MDGIMSAEMMPDQQEAVGSEIEGQESHFLLYRFSTERHGPNSTRPHRHADFIDILAVAGHVEVRCLPIIWQTARASVGLGGTSSIRLAPLDAQTELAFKLIKDEEKISAKKGEIFSLIWNEVSTLGHPELRAHSNIVDLLGICWDIGDDDIVWPALVFEKSHFGDLHRFTSLPRWTQLGSLDRLKICVDIGDAISLMHSHNIIHGDLKPHNVLIFKESDTFVAKVTDFGYSHQYSGAADAYSLPLSEPWQAPEIDGSDTEFSLQEAKRADIYSYALLCAWILYQHRLHECVAHDNANPCSGNNSISSLQKLKSSGQLQKVVLDLVDGDELQPKHKAELRELFRHALASEPSARNEILWSSFKLLKQPDRDAHQPPTDVDTPAIEFKLDTAIVQYYQCDHRVRSYITKCLQQRVDGASQSAQTTNDTVQLAMCYHIGFGVPRNEERSRQLCANQDMTERIHAAINAVGKTSMQLDHPLIRRILAAGSLGNLHQIGQRQNFASLQATENVLVRELDDIGNSIDNLVLKYLITRALIDCLRLQGRLDLVERLESQMVNFDETSLGRDNLATVAGKTNLAHLHWSQGKLDRALGVMEEALQSSRRILGPDDALTLTITGNVAAIYNSLGDFGQAEKLELELQAKRSASLGKDHPDTLTSIANLAAILLRQGRLHDALPLAEQACQARRNIFGNDHPDTVISMSNLALIHQGLERYEEAESLFVKATDTSKRILGEDSPSTLMCMANLALNHWYRDQLQEAEDLGLKVVAKRRYALGRSHPDTLTSIANLALVYESQGRLEEALDLEGYVLEESRAQLGDSHPDTLMSMDNLANTHQNMKHWIEAESLLVEALATRKRVLGETHPDTMVNTHKLLLVLSKLGKENEIRQIGEDLALLSS